MNGTRRRLKDARKPALLLILCGILYLIANTSGAGWLYVVAAGIGAVLLVSLPAPLLVVFPAGARGMEASRKTPESGVVGEPLACTLELRNPGRFGRYLLEVEDRFAGGAARTVVARVPGRSSSGSSKEIEYSVENPQRGVYSGGEIEISSGAPFGLLYGRRRLRAASEAVIYPRTFDVDGLPQPTADGQGAGAARNTLHRGTGGEFWGVREYRPGDPARLVSWRRSARNLHTGQLAVMEFAREVQPPLSLSLDLDRRSPAAVRELIVSAAASVMLQALEEGRKLEVDAGKQQEAFPEAGDRDEVLRWCAGLEASKPPEPAERNVEIRPSVDNLDPSKARSETVVLVSCHELAGPGPWMTPDEELEFVRAVESEGRQVRRLGASIEEPGRLR